MKYYFYGIIKNVIVKIKQTYIERSFFYWVSYLWVNGSHYEGTLLYIAALHSTRQSRESMPAPQVSLFDRHLMTRDCHYRC